MNRREFVRHSVASAALGMQAVAGPAHSSDRGDQTPAPRPNIVLILSDQQRWDTLGCYGRPIFPGLTPNLDQMAAEGVRFDRAYTCQPVCGPARACLQTGRYATEVGCFRNDIALPTSVPTIAEALRGAGHETGYIGKWHLASDGPRGLSNRTSAVPPELRGGYEYWLASDVLEFTSHGYDGHMFDGDMRQVDFPEGRYRADCLTDWAVGYLRSRSLDRPFFLFLSYIEPHHQNDHKHFEGPHGSKERFEGYRVPGDLAGRQGDWEEEMPDYLGCVSALDTGVGRIRGALDELGLVDTTLVLYTTDHGCHFHTRNGEYKRTCHENTIRIPLVACGPGFRGGRAVGELVSLLDIPRTALAAGGATALPDMRGHSLQALVAGKCEPWREEVLVQISESQVGRCIRTPRWTYSVFAPGRNGGQDMGSDTYEEQYLYDNDADPYQATNLVADDGLRGLRAELAERLRKCMVAAGEARPAIVPAKHG